MSVGSTLSVAQPHRQPDGGSGGARPRRSARDPGEIIAKKIYYRGAAMQPRDMFDIACVVKTHGVEYLSDALMPFRDKYALRH